LDGHEEGEQYFVLLKQRAANVAIQIVHEVGAQNFEPFLEVIGLLTINDREDEELDKPRERVLVHRLNVTHLCQKFNKKDIIIIISDKVNKGCATLLFIKC
jgi:hypothetical protein